MLASTALMAGSIAMIIRCSQDWSMFLWLAAPIPMAVGVCNLEGKPLCGLIIGISTVAFFLLILLIHH
jgi:hypothetical protein